MRTTTTLCDMQRRYLSLLALLVCSSSWLLQPSQAFKLPRGYGEEKVPLSFIVPDPSRGLSPLAAPPPVTGADEDDGMRPKLPTERWRRGRGEERRGKGEGRHAPPPHAPALAPSALISGPASAPAPASANAPTPDSGTEFIESSPAVPVPRGVTDTATILPMPAPGVKRQDMGAATLVRAGVVPLVAVLIISIMATLGAF